MIKRNRKSIRLKYWDYSSPGYYFVTICTFKRQHIFGHISNGKMYPNICGKIIDLEWNNTAKIRKNIKLDQYHIMPDHFHGIIIITEGAYCNTPQPNHNTPQPIINTPQPNHNTPQPNHNTPQPNRNTPQPNRNTPQRKFIPRQFESPENQLGSIIRGFKSTTTKQINKILNESKGKIWQRNYYEKIIRNETELNRIRKYIKDNPKNWKG